MEIAVTLRMRQGILSVPPCGSRGHCLGLPSALAAGDALSLGRADQVFSPFFTMIIICGAAQKVKHGMGNYPGAAGSKEGFFFIYSRYILGYNYKDWI